MSEISPTARALRALDVLQTRPGVTAAELADRLGVTERAARRYVAILREADIPVESTRGPHGGYTLGRGLRLPPPNVARQAVMLRETARSVPERVSAKPDPGVTTELVGAVAAQRQVRLGYRTAAGNPRTFEV